MSQSTMCNMSLRTPPLLAVDKLQVSIHTPEGFKTLIQNVSFTIPESQTYVLLGGSGSGKSVTALSILQLLPNSALYGQGSRILYENDDLLSLSGDAMRRIRGGKIAMIFQEPTLSLNPVITVGEQIKESLYLHKKLNSKEALHESLELLEAVQIQNPKRVQTSYPHQLSGGMKQRIMIAMALAGKPKLLIADEPTTALDVTTQKKILELLRSLQEQFQMSILFITHDLNVACAMGDEVGIMRAGEIVEQGKIGEILKSPKEPYTRLLLNTRPQLSKQAIKPDASNMLAVTDVSLNFPIIGGIFNRKIAEIPAVQNVSLNLRKGETLALVGESGCGKTTLAKVILGLLKPDLGQVQWLGETINTLSSEVLRRKRGEVQIIFQDPFGSMDPRFSVREIILEGMKALNVGCQSHGDFAEIPSSEQNTKALKQTLEQASDKKLLAINAQEQEQEQEQRVDNLLEQVGLLPEHKHRYPHQFSGGQRQRICIARALAVNPKVIVCDEPTSSLDAPIGAAIIDLLVHLQQELELSYLFITHNLAIVRSMAHNVAVMQQGKIVEYGECEQVLNRPAHPYTQMLLESSLRKFYN